MVPPAMCVRLLRIFAAYKARREIVRALPIRMWVESASCCNLRCPMCPNKDMPGREKGVMPLELFRKIVEEAQGFLNDMYLHHRGEPLLNPNLFAMITLAREAGIRTRFHTNGTLLDADKAAALLEAAPDLVSFSVDGFDKATYESIRVGADFDVTVENIVRLAEARRQRGLRKPYLVVEKIRFRSPPPGETPEHVAALRARFLAAGVNEVIQKEEYAWASEDAPPPADTRTCAACTFPWYAMVVCADGTVTPCPQDFWANLKMGDAARDRLADIWNDAPYRELRRSFRAEGTLRPICSRCDRLHRKTVGGVPFQYMITFLVDQLAGYGRLRRWVGTAERN